MADDLAAILAKLEAERMQPMARWRPPEPEPLRGDPAALVEACFPKHWRAAHRLRQAQKEQAK